MRIDEYLVKKLDYESRNKAKNDILNGNILINHKICIKPSYCVKENDIVTIKERMKYVSRGGYKLEDAKISFNLNFVDKIILDIGSSTGGFTDFSIQNGAKKVYCIDVGTNQLHESLRSNNKIEIYENTNILSYPKFKDTIDIIVTDVSFISILKLIDVFKYYLTDENYAIVLIKPQFELEGKYFKNGIVKNQKDIKSIILKIHDEFFKNKIYFSSIKKCNLKGKDGNQEYLVKISKKSSFLVDIFKFLNNI